MARKDADSSGFSTRAVAAPPVFPSAQPELDASLLTDLARCFWAKSGDGESTWLSVVQHLMDAADIAGYLFDEYLSEHHRRLMALFGEGIKRRPEQHSYSLRGFTTWKSECGVRVPV